MEELKRLRMRRGYSQRQLAARSGIDQGSISDIEAGKRSPSVSTLERLVGAMDAEMADLYPKVQAPLFDEEGQWRSSEDVRESCARILDACFALGLIGQASRGTEEYQTEYQLMSAIYQELTAPEGSTPSSGLGHSLLRHVEQRCGPECRICHPQSAKPVREEFEGRRPASKAASLREFRDESRV